MFVEYSYAFVQKCARSDASRDLNPMCSKMDQFLVLIDNWSIFNLNDLTTLSLFNLKVLPSLP